MKLLTRSSLRYADAHRWQAGLSIVGVALGVAVVVSVDLANASAQRAFELSNDAVTGRATHQVVGGPGGVPERTYARLRTDLGVRRVAPVAEGIVEVATRVAEDGAPSAGRTLRLLGIDPFSEAPFRATLGTAPMQLDLAQFLTRPGAIVLSPATAAHLGVQAGDRLAVQVAGRDVDLHIGALLPAGGAAADLLLADVATAQETLGMVGRLSHLDLIVDDGPAGEALLERLRAALPAGTRLVSAAARGETTRQLTGAFRVNLAALSLLALVCGAFLVYNTVAFSVVQRRRIIGTLRALGVTRGEIFARVLGEAAVVGCAGTLLGLAGGTALGRFLVTLVTRTINDLYFVVSVRELAIDPWSLAKGATLGLAGAVLAALPSALEATRAPPRGALLRSHVEARAQARALPAAAVGVLLLLCGGGLLALAQRSLVLSFAALFGAILGFALLTPAVVIACMRLSTPPMGALMGPVGRIAARGVSASLSRTAVAIAALMIATSVVVGVGVMIASFRGTVVSWLEATLIADLYVAPPSAPTRPASFLLDEAARARLEAIDGVQRVTTVRRVELPDRHGGRVRVAAFDITPADERAFPLVSGSSPEAWRAFRREGAVFVTEPYAYRHGVARGDAVELLTDAGPRSFPIAGVYYNYVAEEGLVALDRDTYERHWNDRAISALAVHLRDDVDLAAVSAEVSAALAGRGLSIRSNRSLRQASLEIFDRTFLITGVLRLLVTLVAVIGVFSALMSLQLERAHEIGVLRALGLTPGEVWRLSVSQSGLMGLVAGLLALPVGLSLALIMIFVINRRSFGWTLVMDPAPGILLQAFALALLAALAAGLYPALRLSRTPPATALREE